MMTESEAIDACRKKAARRPDLLGAHVTAFLNNESLAAKVPQSPLPLGHWSVVFRKSGFDTEQYFTVDDATGAVTWVNEPPSKWLEWSLYAVLYPLYWLMAGSEAVFGPLYRRWMKFRLPRCPHCRAKLRTNLSKQCFNCGQAWHRPADQRR